MFDLEPVVLADIFEPVLPTPVFRSGADRVAIEGCRLCGEDLRVDL
jgi:hypothetical protein